MKDAIGGLLILVTVLIVVIILFPSSIKKTMNKEEILVNPYMGFAPSADGGPYEQPHSLVYANFTWKELEPEKGVFGFEAIEEKYMLDYWREQDIKLIFRVVLDYPKAEIHKDIPEWLYQEINQQGTWYEHEWGSGFSPNYNNKKLIYYHEKLIEALGKRYNDDPVIAFIELGSLGHWGEWHTLQQDGIYIPFPKLDISDIYVNHYVHHFDNKLLLMRRPYQIAKDNKMGLYNDMFGREDHTIEEFHSWVNDGYEFWLTNEQHPAMADAWSNAPIGGEFAPTDNWDDYFTDRNLKNVLKQLELTHVSWLGPSTPGYYPKDGEHQKRINQFLNKIGYHFRLINASYPKNVQQGSSFQLKMKWENSGVAPFYFDWPLEVALLDDNENIVYRHEVDTDIRKWLPGKHEVTVEINLPNTIDNGKYKLLVSILDPEEMKPGIELEMDGKRADGRYEIGSMTVQ